MLSLLCFSVAMVKHPDPKQVGEGKVAYRLEAIVKGSQGRNLEPRPRQWGSTAYCLAGPSFLGAMLVQLWLTCPGVVWSTVGWTLLDQLASKSISHRHSHRPI